MEDSQSESNIFSVRIVSIDYYMNPPVPGIDICYTFTESSNFVLGVGPYASSLRFLVSDFADEDGTRVRKGVLPRLLDEILSTRIMVKKAMKKLAPSQKVLSRLALKLIANVTYGYTAAGFSGRMPCAELADSIVQCGRRTLETAISLVHIYWTSQIKD
ncbi:hypothetical protein LguiB_035875 [Lonicera macranthoides]